MRLQSIQVEGFGRICNVRWPSLSPRVNVFLGPNEAGKTTLLDFIHAVLAGFPRNWREYYLPVADVEHGGSLQIRAADGDIWVIRRTAGAKGGRLEIHRGGRPVANPQKELDQLIGHLSPETFRQIFTFGVDELHEMELLDIQDVNARVYSAGSGVPQLPAVLARLQDERDQIYTPRARKKEIIEAAERIQQIDGELAVLKDARREHERIDVQLEAIDARLAAVDESLLSRQKRLDEARSLGAGYRIWSEIVALKERLRRMEPVEPVPAEAVERMETINGAASRCRQELEALTLTAATLQQDSLTQTQLLLLTREATIEQLFAARESLQNAQTAMEQAREAVTRAAERKEQLVTALGNAWSEEAIARFAATDELREAVIEFQPRFAATSAPLAEARGELATAERRIDEAKKTISAMSAEMAKLPPGADLEQVAARKQAVREARKVVEALRRISDERARREAATAAQASRPALGPAAVWVSVALSIVAAVIAVVSSSTLRTGASAVAAVLFAIAVVLWVRRNAASGLARSSATATPSEEEHLQAAALQLRRQLSLRELTHEALERIDDEIARAEVAAQSHAQLNARLSELERVKGECEADAEAIAARIERSETAARELQTEWSALVARCGLPGGTTPDVAVTLLDRLRAAAVAIREWRVAQEVLETHERGFAERVTAIERLRMEAQLPTTGSPLVQLDALYGALSEARQTAARANKAAEQREILEQSLAEKRRELAGAEETLGAVLLDLRAGSVETARHRVEAAQQRRNAEERLQQLIATLTNAVGSPEAFEARLSAFGEINEEMTNALLREIKLLTAERDQLRDERQKGASRLETIENADRTTDLLAEREQLSAKVRVLGREWLVTTVALSLLNETKLVYERERKPKVIEYAEQFFDSATGGTYRHISAPTGSAELTVYRHDQSAVPPENLSRGTLEQLYLALRLGFIRQLAEQRVTPPVVVDEILVNADSIRAARIAEGLYRISETNQVLVFTCHRWVAELFRPSERTNEVRVIELEECA